MIDLDSAPAAPAGTGNLCEQLVADGVPVEQVLGIDPETGAFIIVCQN